MQDEEGQILVARDPGMPLGRLRGRDHAVQAVGARPELEPGVRAAIREPAIHEPPGDAKDYLQQADEARIERAAAQLFSEAAKVIMGPRCMNCHPASDRPLQGNDKHPHLPPVVRGEAGVERDHRPPRRQVAGAAVAEPTTAQADILILGYGIFPK